MTARCDLYDLPVEMRRQSAPGDALQFLADDLAGALVLLGEFFAECRLDSFGCQVVRIPGVEAAPDELGEGEAAVFPPGLEILPEPHRGLGSCHAQNHTAICCIPLDMYLCIPYGMNMSNTAETTFTRRDDALAAIEAIVGDADADLTLAAAEDAGLYSDDTIYVAVANSSYYVLAVKA